MYVQKVYKKGKRKVEAVVGGTKTAYKVAKKALDVALTVQALVNVEYKSHKTTLQTDPNTSGNVAQLTGIAEGIGFNQRIGRSIKSVSLSIKGIISINGSATSTNYRLLIVRDNSGTTTVPAITDLFDSVAVFILNKNKLGDSQSNARFTVLSDTFYHLDIQNENSTIAIKIWKKLNFHVRFSGAAASDEGKGAIYAFQASSEASLDPIVSVDTMYKYIDN